MTSAQLKAQRARLVYVPENGRGFCSCCGNEYTLNSDGTLRGHSLLHSAGGTRDHRCPGEFKPPVDDPPCELIGIWILAVVDDGIVRWGIGGKDAHPYEPEQEDDAIKAARRLSLMEKHIDDCFYLLYVFEDGRLKQCKFEPASPRSPHRARRFQPMDAIQRTAEDS